jgi:hypothetical protein
MNISANLNLTLTHPTRLKGNSQSINIRNHKTTPRLGESESRRLPDLASRGVAMVSQGIAIQTSVSWLLDSLPNTYNFGNVLKRKRGKY